MSRSAQQAPADSVTTLHAETGSPRPVPKAKRRHKRGTSGPAYAGKDAVGPVAQPLHNWQASRWARKTAKGANFFLPWLSALGSKIFEADDRLARDQGWQITPRRGGLSRSYRDPRFDSLVACAACIGRGHNPRGVACPDCDGTGRIVLTPTAIFRPD